MQLTDRIKGAIESFVTRLTSKYDYAGFCAYIVVAQNADDTLELKPVDPNKHPPLSKVEMRFETPATRCRVKVGAECTVVFANMDPSRYFAFGGFKHGDFEELHFGDNTVPIARQGDFVTSGGPGTLIQFTPMPGNLAPSVIPGVPYYVSFSSITDPLMLESLEAFGPLPGFIITASEVNNTQ